jgi:hypothetical protein
MIVNKLSVLVASLCVAAHTLAQSPAVTLTALSPIGVGSTLTTPPTFVGVPAGAPAGALDLGTSGTGADGARILTSTEALTGGAAFQVVTGVQFSNATTLVAAGTTSASSPAGAAFGPVDLLASFQAPPGATCRVIVIASANGSTGSHVAVNRAQVDVGADGTVEFTSPSPQGEVPVVVGASGTVRVRVTVENHVFGTGTFLSTTVTSVRLLLPSTSCSITPFGSGCNGAASTGTHQLAAPSRVLFLNLTGAFPQQPVLSLFGSQNTGPTIGGCGLLTDGAISQLLFAPPSGSITWGTAIPHDAVGTLYHQFLSIDLPTFSVRASNGLQIVCQ